MAGFDFDQVFGDDYLHFSEDMLTDTRAHHGRQRLFLAADPDRPGQMHSSRQPCGW